MKTVNTELAERVYELVNGELDMSAITILENSLIKNEFEDGSVCSRAYSRMLGAYSRLSERLGVEEWDDDDVDIVIDELRGIAKHLGKKMFEYGMMFGRREQQLEQQ